MICLPMYSLKATIGYVPCLVESVGMLSSVGAGVEKGAQSVHCRCSHLYTIKQRSVIVNILNGIVERSYHKK